MVKSVLGVSHQGLRDWLFQRITAVIMAVYTVWLIAFFFFHSPLTYTDWHILFSHVWMKVGTVLFIAAVLFHAWVGMWTVITDYIKIFSVRLVVQILVLFALLTCLVWAVEILWSV